MHSSTLQTLTAYDAWVTDKLLQAAATELFCCPHARSKWCAYLVSPMSVWENTLSTSGRTCNVYPRIPCSLARRNPRAARLR